MEARAQTIVAQRYALHERVGQGGCGVVYRATDQSTGDTVAIKMLSRAARQNPSFVERLVREQQALLALAGTHAVAAIDLCRADTGELCLVMEWLQGADLEQHLSTREQAGTRFTVDELLQVMRPVLETLAKAHELGIVHRDVKPANIFLLSENRGVRLLDFGFSRLKTSATLTAADTVMGSPSYIAPEAWLEGSKAIGKQADLYAAGVIVFRALAGRVPFESASLVETMQLVTTAPRPRLSELRPELPKVMDAWLECALAVAPEHRFQHAQSFLEALVAALSGVDLPRHTLPAGAAHALPPPPPKITPGERQNALSTALGRAASLLKRVASSFSRAPTPATEATPGASPPEPSSAEHAEVAGRPGLAPPPQNPPSRVRTKPALPPVVRPRASSPVLPAAKPASDPLPESDLLIAELLPPSMPPPAPPAAPLEPLEPSPTPVLEPALPSRADSRPEAPARAKSSKQKPRTRRRPAASQPSSAKTRPPKRVPAKPASSQARVRKATDPPAPETAAPETVAAAKTAAKKTAAKKTTAKKTTAKKTAAKKTAAKKTTAKKTAAKKTTARKETATKQEPPVIAAAAQRAALEQTKPKPSASKSPKSKRPHNKAVNPAKASVGNVDRNVDRNVEATIDRVDKNSEHEPPDRN